jgi:hypothetical protein
MILTLSRTGNTRITLPGIFLPIALYSNIQDNQTVYIICYVISKHISVILQSFSIFVTTIVAVQRLCICAFPFKTRFIFTMRNTVIALVTTFFYLCHDDVTVNGSLVVSAILYISYFRNIWVDVFMSKSFRERLLTMLYMTSAR